MKCQVINCDKDAQYWADIGYEFAPIEFRINLCEEHKLNTWSWSDKEEIMKEIEETKL